MEAFVRFVLPALGLTLGAVFGTYALGWPGTGHLSAGKDTPLLIASAVCLAAAVLLAVLANRRSQREKWRASRAGNDFSVPREEESSRGG